MEPVAGLDIGTTKICIVVGEIDNHGKVNILGVGMSPCKGLRRGVVIDLDETTEAISQALRKANQMTGFPIDSVYVGVTGEHIASLNTKGTAPIPITTTREITKDDVERVLESAKTIVLPPDREILHAIPRDYTVDGQRGIKYPVGMSGARLDVDTHIVTGAVTFLQNVEKCVLRAGLSVDAMVLEPIASGESVLSDAEKEIGVAMVDIGGGTSDVAVFSDGSISYSGVVPIGGQYVTLDISKLLRVAPEEAERLKVEFGNALAEIVPEDETVKITQIGSNMTRLLPKRVIAEIIEPRMSELFVMVKQHLARANTIPLLPGGVVLTGGGSKLDGIVELAREILGNIPVRTAGPSKLLGLNDTVSNPIYATAVGLVLYGLHTQKHEKQNQINGWKGWLQNLINQFLQRIKR